MRDEDNNEGMIKEGKELVKKRRTMIGFIMMEG